MEIGEFKPMISMPEGSPEKPKTEEQPKEEKKYKVTVLDLLEIPSSVPERIGKFDVIIIYRTEDGKVYSFSVPKEEFSEEKLPELIREDLERRLKIIGKTYVV